MNACRRHARLQAKHGLPMQETTDPLEDWFVQVAFSECDSARRYTYPARCVWSPEGLADVQVNRRRSPQNFENVLLSNSAFLFLSQTGFIPRNNEL